MPENKKEIINYRCPVCLMQEFESYLNYNSEKNIYLCQHCAFAGNESEINEYYKIITKKYKLLNKRIKIKLINK